MFRIDANMLHRSRETLKCGNGLPGQSLVSIARAIDGRVTGPRAQVPDQANSHDCTTFSEQRSNRTRKFFLKKAS